HKENPESRIRNFTFQISDLIIHKEKLKPRTSNQKSQIPNPKSQISNLKSQISNLKSHSLPPRFPRQCSLASTPLRLDFPLPPASALESPTSNLYHLASALHHPVSCSPWIAPTL